MGTWYATREQVKSALDLDETARADAQIDRAIEAASRNVEKLCHRQFYPVKATRYFDWPNRQRARAWRLWLDQYELVSVSAMTAGSNTIALEDIYLEPVNAGPPYNRVELNVGGSSTFSALPGTWQRAISVTGVFGWPESLSAVTELTSSASDTATTIDVAGGASVGVGSLLKVGSEFLIVTSRSMIDTGEVCSDLTALKNSRTIDGITSGSIQVGETISVEGEQMLVTDVLSDTTDTLYVERAVNGTTLAAHTGSPAVYGSRRLGVTRGVNGTAAAAHDDADVVYAHAAPGPVTALTVAYALDELQQEQTAYARTVGTGEAQRNATGGAIKSLEANTYNNYGRKVRIRGV